LQWGKIPRTLNTTTEEQMTQKHTALPWKLSDQDLGTFLKCGNGYPIAIISENPDCKANAALIVRAVNSHYELLAALKDATRIVEQCGQWQDTNETTTQIFKEEIEKFEAAISKAEAAE
jgi:hypothetical protein